MRYVDRDRCAMEESRNRNSFRSLYSVAAVTRFRIVCQQHMPLLVILSLDSQRV